MQVELVLLGVIAVAFSVVFIFLCTELSTRKKKLVSDIKFTLNDLPSKLSERPRENKPLLDTVHVFLHSGKTKFDAPSIKKPEPYWDQAKTLTEKIKRLKELSIGELETIRTMVKEYHDHLPEGIDIYVLLTRANQMLEPFIPHTHEFEGKPEGNGMTGDDRKPDEGEDGKGDKNKTLTTELSEYFEQQVGVG